MIGLRVLLSTPGLWARLRLRRELRPFLRMQFLAVAIEMEVLDTLRSPRTLGELNDRLKPARPDTLETFLALGVALGELSCRRAVYRLRSRTACTLAAPGGASLRAGVIELVDYHAAAYRELSRHLLSGSKTDYLFGRGELIARSSRLVEPVLAVFVHELVGNGRPMRILELGCGSGIYLRYASEANSRVIGIGVERDPAVVDATRKSLSQWGLSNHFSIRQADARRLPLDLVGNFDLITLYNNIYYFAVDERTALFGALHARLTQGGSLALVSMMRGTTPASLGLSLVLAGTHGCSALPSEDELISDLRQGGFARVERRHLMPGEPLVGLIATP